jgi:hypothetical protein
MAKRSRLAALLCARVFVMRETQTDRAPAKYGHVSRETGSDKRKPGVVPVFRSSVPGFVARMERSAIRERHIRCTAAPGLRFAPSGLRRKKKNEGSGTPANADPHPPHLAMRLAPFWSALICRRSTTALTQGSIPSPRLSFRPGFLGRGLNGRYPPSPVPVQGCTSHPGHNAGRLIPKPPGSRLQTRPRAPPSLP